MRALWLGKPHHDRGVPLGVRDPPRGAALLSSRCPRRL